MAVPFIVFVMLLSVAAGLYFFGKSRDALGATTVFVALSAVVLVSTGAFLMAEGLELPIVESFDESGSMTTPTYQVLQSTEGSAMWMISNIIFWMGAVLLILALVYAAWMYRDAKAEQSVLDEFNW